MNYKKRIIVLVLLFFSHYSLETRQMTFEYYSSFTSQEILLTVVHYKRNLSFTARLLTHRYLHTAIIISQKLSQSHRSSLGYHLFLYISTDNGISYNFLDGLLIFSWFMTYDSISDALVVSFKAVWLFTSDLKLTCEPLLGYS